MNSVAISMLLPSGVASLAMSNHSSFELQVSAFAFSRILQGDIRAKRNHRVTHRDFGIASRTILIARVANAVRPVLDLFAITAAYRSGMGGLATGAEKSPLALVSNT